MTKKGGVTSLMAIYIFLTEKTNSYSVAIGYVRSKSFVLANQIIDKNGCLLVIETIVDDVKFVFINICNCDTESHQLLTLTALHKILQHVDDVGNKNITVGGDFNFHFNSKLEAKGGKPKKSIGKMIELIESFELFDIWRM